MRQPRGIRNNNPLNIRKGNNWQGERPRQTDKQFEEFVSMEMGIRAGFKLIRNYITGFGGRRRKITTLDGIIRKWAPPIENATEKYIQFVADTSGVNRYEHLRFEDRSKMVSIVSAMIRMECGQTVPIETIETAYDLV